jgi:hypothetical protein
MAARRELADRIPDAVSPMDGYALDAAWDNTQRGANHAHSVWRDPTADFGFDGARHRRIDLGSTA